MTLIVLTFLFAGLLLSMAMHPYWWWTITAYIACVALVLLFIMETALGQTQR